MLNEHSSASCVFCDKELKDDIVLVKKGLERIREVSLQLNDCINSKLGVKTSVTIHKNCRQKYTHPSRIQTVLKEKENCESDCSSSLALRDLENKFDFKNDCFICEEHAASNTKAPHERRESVHLVSTLEAKENFLKRCDERNNDWGKRVQCKPEARYHKKCLTDFYRTTSSDKKSIGRPSIIGDSFSKLCEYIESTNECQFTVDELQSRMDDFSNSEQRFSDKYFKKLLKDHFKNRIYFSKTEGKVNIVSSSNSTKDIRENTEAERLKIVLSAAEIIKEDIQKMHYESEQYPSMEEIKSGGEDLVPASLQAFMARLLEKKKPASERNFLRKCTVLNHVIISSLRPRSFISPILTAFGLTIHRLYGSKHLIDLLSAMGVCASYSEISIYMNSLINAGSPEIKEDAFIQYVFDNADVNVRTLDGLNSFHAMGGIQCVTPSSSVEAQVKVKRCKSGGFNCEAIRELSYAKKKSRSGLSNTSIEDVKTLFPPEVSQLGIQNRFIFPANILWLAGSNIQPGWNGFMTSIMREEKNCEISYILGLPFINLNPSNPSTIFSALSFASEQCRKRNHACIVTFDQPLFLKASEIVASAENDSDLSRVIVRLGGFHLLMSFLGSIGKIMEGSGLEELWATVYGQSTINHMLNGHAYARCVRAYNLTAAALLDVMKESSPDVKEVFESLEKYSIQLLRNEREKSEVLLEADVVEALEKVHECFNHIKSLSRTTRLWVNLMQCIDIIMKFIYAERTGDWDLHMCTTIEMLPYFHAAGHLPYAKSAQLHVQNMSKIESKLSVSDFKNFKQNGFFTVRRKESFWSGTWTDMCIEQDLMRPMKAVGGLTHGRGITNSTLSKWILGTPYFLKVHEAIEEFLGTSIHYNEQHAELRESRKQIDLRVLEKFTTWLKQHNPFAQLSGELVSLATGFVCDESVNCDQAYEIGLRTLNRITGKNFGELTLHRKDMVKTQNQSKKIKCRSKEVLVNSQQLFNRILCVCDSSTKLKKYLEYELSSIPPSLYDDVSLRKGTKSSAMKMFEEGIVDEISSNDTYYVLDGGCLLHHVIWAKNLTYGEILRSYYLYIKEKYGSNVVIVFDGYPDEPTTKNEEQNRRSKNSSCDILFERNTKCVTPKENFLANKNNKK